VWPPEVVTDGPPWSCIPVHLFAIMPGMVVSSPPARRVRHLCTACGAESPKWQGRCPGCEAWNTLEAAPSKPRGWSPVECGRRSPRGWPATRAPSTASPAPRRSGGPPASASATGCSAGASSPARWCCSGATPGSASRPSPCSSPAAPAGPTGRPSTAPARSRPPSWPCAPSGSPVPAPRSRCSRRPTSTSCWPPSRRAGRPWR